MVRGILSKMIATLANVSFLGDSKAVSARLLSYDHIQVFLILSRRQGLAARTSFATSGEKSHAFKHTIVFRL